jgi:cytochrome c oxidase subunit II
MNRQLLPLFADGTVWLEPAASTSAHRHDAVFHTVLYVTGFFFILVMLLMLTFIVLYRRRKGQHPENAPTHNTGLEIAWTLIPLGVVSTFFVLGFRAFLEDDTPPVNAEVIDVEARQWSYTFSYPSGGQSDRLYLRVNRPVLLNLHSSDVLHSLYIPAFRIQRNAVPGREVQMWFQPTQLGTYHIFCTQYCGDGHSRMTTEAVVLEEDEYQAKLAELANIFIDPEAKAPRSYAAVGELLYKSAGCSQCHSVDGSPNVGPTWKGLYKRDHEFSTAPQGYTLKASDDDAKWDAYLRESVLKPDAKVVEGFQNVMQPYAARFSGSPYKDKQLTAIVEYIKSLDDHGPGGGPKYYHPMPVPAPGKPASESKTGPAGRLPPPPPLPPGELERAGRGTQANRGPQANKEKQK